MYCRAIRAEARIGVRDVDLVLCAVLAGKCVVRVGRVGVIERSVNVRVARRAAQCEGVLISQ